MKQQFTILIQEIHGWWRIRRMPVLVWADSREEAVDKAIAGEGEPSPHPREDWRKADECKDGSDGGHSREERRSLMNPSPFQDLRSYINALMTLVNGGHPVPQRQDSAQDQLRDLLAVGELLGMRDAVDTIKERILRK